MLPWAALVNNLDCSPHLTEETPAFPGGAIERARSQTATCNQNGNTVVLLRFNSKKFRTHGKADPLGSRRAKPSSRRFEREQCALNKSPHSAIRQTRSRVRLEDHQRNTQQNR